jgi:hypothetical protein
MPTVQLLAGQLRRLRRLKATRLKVGPHGNTNESEGRLCMRRRDQELVEVGLTNGSTHSSWRCFSTRWILCPESRVPPRRVHTIVCEIPKSYLDKGEKAIRFLEEYNNNTLESTKI